MPAESTTCLIAGGGPAGIVLGLLLARAGVDVHVLEKHDDFLRDFRGDTVHPTTQALLDQLGLTEEFASIVRGRIREVEMSGPDGVLMRVPLARAAFGSRFDDIALAPQWDLLDLLVREGSRQASFRITMGADVRHLLRNRRGDVVGAEYVADGETVRERAVLTVVAAGRRTALRTETGSSVRDLRAPMDVLWLRLPRSDGDGAGLLVRLGDGDMAIAIDRGDYWQVAYLIPAGTDADVRAAGLEALRDRLGALLRFPDATIRSLSDLDEVKTLRVGLDRLERWWSAGLLVIGDAAHTMSPVGGVGINLAVQDAVASANVLAPLLLRAQEDPDRFEKTFTTAPLARIQRRRAFPARVTQAVQRLVHRRVIERAFANRGPRIPFLLAADLRHGGLVARLAARALAWGIRPERIRGIAGGPTVRRHPR